VNELLILDICCGAGTIGQCLIAALNKSNRLEGSPIVGVRCLGVELLADACEDARENARENGLSSL
jgi:methylase of polypeptide subunit release factors